MANVEIVLNRDGVRSLLHEAGAICMELAESAAARCGEGFIAEKRTYPERSGAIVKTNSAAAARENLNNNTILKAVRGT